MSAKYKPLPFPPLIGHDIHAFQLLRRDLLIDDCRYQTVHMEMQCGASIHSPTIAQLPGATPTNLECPMFCVSIPKYSLKQYFSTHLGAQQRHLSS